MWEKCKNCQKEFKKTVKRWVIEEGKEFKLCRKCSDKYDREIWEKDLKEYQKDNPLEKKEKEVVKMDKWKAFFFLTTISLFIILIVVLNKGNVKK